jgi:hypothetical protein
LRGSAEHGGYKDDRAEREALQALDSFHFFSVANERRRVRVGWLSAVDVCG